MSFFLGFNLSVAMAEPTTCLSEISIEQGWGTFSQSKLACMSKDPVVIESLSLLCTKEQNDFSAIYVTYLEYKQKYAAAANRYVQTKDPIDLFAMNKTNHEWQIFGYKPQVSKALSGIYQASGNSECDN